MNHIKSFILYVRLLFKCITGISAGIFKSFSYFQILSHRELYRNENLLCNYKLSSLIDYNRFKSKIKGPYRNPLVLIGETSSTYKTECSPKSGQIEDSTLEVIYQCLFVRCYMATLMLVTKRAKM